MAEDNIQQQNSEESKNDKILTSCFWQKKMPRFSSIVEYIFVVNEMPDRQ